MYRLHIDIPMQMDEAAAETLSREIIAVLLQHTEARLRAAGVGEVNYRLGHDEDRQKSNYLLKTDSGHVVNKKSRVHFDFRNYDTEHAQETA